MTINLSKKNKNNKNKKFNNQINEKITTGKHTFTVREHHHPLALFTFENVYCVSLPLQWSRMKYNKNSTANRQFLLLLLFLLLHQPISVLLYLSRQLVKQMKNKKQKRLEQNKQRCCLFVAVWLWLKLETCLKQSHWLCMKHLHTFLMQFFEIVFSISMIIQFLINLPVWLMVSYQRKMNPICKVHILGSAQYSYKFSFFFIVVIIRLEIWLTQSWCSTIMAGIRWSKQLRIAHLVFVFLQE